MKLGDEQEDQILNSYKVMHQMLSKIAVERNEKILPQLGLEGMNCHPVSLATPCPKLYSTFIC